MLSSPLEVQGSQFLTILVPGLLFHSQYLAYEAPWKSYYSRLRLPNWRTQCKWIVLHGEASRIGQSQQSSPRNENEGETGQPWGHHVHQNSYGTSAAIRSFANFSQEPAPATCLTYQNSQYNLIGTSCQYRNPGVWSAEDTWRLGWMISVAQYMSKAPWLSGYSSFVQSYLQVYNCFMFDVGQ